MNPEGNSLLVNGKQNGILEGYNFQYLDEELGRLGGNYSFKNTDFKLNYEFGLRSDFSNFSLNYNFLGIDGGFEGVSSTNRSVPLVPNFDYPLSDAVQEGLNNALDQNPSVDIYIQT